MKKLLLLLFVTLLTFNTQAQLIKRSDVPTITTQPSTCEAVGLSATEETAMMSDRLPVRAPLCTTPIKAGYYRPAGAWYGNFKISDGVYNSYLYAPYVVVTPFEGYTFKGNNEGASDDATYTWRYQLWDSNNKQRSWHDATGRELTVSYGHELDSVPIVAVTDKSGSDTYYLCGHKMGGNSSKPTIEKTFSSWMASICDMEATWSYRILQLSHYFGGGGRNADHYSMNTYYSGAKAWGNNEKGWWFGKNASGINGVATIFEAPQHPYLLKHVDVIVTQLTVTGEVHLTCKVYKLSGTQGYNESASVYMSTEPGRLIATGHCTIDENSNTGGLLEFTLMSEDNGQEHEVTPTVDYPIMVAFTGYNDSDCDALTNFTVLMSNERVDEGFGEQCYLLREITDDAGNVETSYWQGLNNFFSSGEMKTGFSIGIDADHPYLAYNYSVEDGEYLFSDEGGLMRKELVYEYATFYTESIEFYAYTPSADKSWTLTCNGGDVPDWLNIILEDGEDNDAEFNNVVTAIVTAEPLPDGVAYREAQVKFEIPGNYKIYTFRQGDVNAKRATGDVNGDGEVTIADVNAIIDLILSGGYDQYADVNGDGEVTIADVNAVVDIILGNT